MKFSVSHSDDTTTLKIGVEKLDSKVAPDLKSQFILLANDENSGHLIVDMSTISFADSSGLSALLLANRLYRETERELVFFGVQERIMKLIEISQLTSIFNLASDESAAREFINAD
jgi:anti-anti-sigma factor